MASKNMSALKAVKKIKRERKFHGYFIPVTTKKGLEARLRLVYASTEDAVLMAKWRTSASESFFTWIKPSENDLLQWLKDYERSNDDLLFVLERDDGLPVGQMALYNIEADSGQAEFGRIIRGEQGAPKGIMSAGALALLRWGFELFGLAKIYLEVFADNIPAISMYKRLGFRAVSSVPFVKRFHPGGIIRWEKSKLGRGSNGLSKEETHDVLKMVLTRNYLTERQN